MKQTTQTYLSLPETFILHSPPPATVDHARCYPRRSSLLFVKRMAERPIWAEIYKLALDGGMTCPNRDGTLGTAAAFSAATAVPAISAEPAHTSVTEQIEAAKARVANKIKGWWKICRISSPQIPMRLLPIWSRFFRSNRPPGRGCPVHRNPPDRLPPDVLSFSPA